MKKLNKWLMLILAGASSIGLALHFDGESGPQCDVMDRAETRCADPETNCKCWCASCGTYRDKRSGALGNDTPVYQNGTCYCNPRDVEGGNRHNPQDSYRD